MVSEDNNENDDENDDVDVDKEEDKEPEDNTYVIMMGFTSTFNGIARPNAKEQLGIYEETQKNEELDDQGGKGQKKVAEEDPKEEGNEFKEQPYVLNNILCNKLQEDVLQASSREIGNTEKPRSPLQIQPASKRHEELFYLSPAWKSVEDQKEIKDTSTERQDDDKCEKKEEEDPYTSTLLDDGVYDMILNIEVTERRKGGKSFIMNRPPAPAPRPVSVPGKERNTSYIAQVFQQNVTRSHEKVLYAVKKPDRNSGEKTTYTAIKPNIILRQEDLILLQEQVKRGCISVDEALEKFKQWQDQESQLETSQQIIH